MTKPNVQNSRNFLHMLPVAMAWLSSDDSAMLCTSGFVSDVMFSDNGQYGVRSLCGHRAAASGATLFDFVVIYNGSKFGTGGGGRCLLFSVYNCLVSKAPFPRSVNRHSYNFPTCGYLAHQNNDSNNINKCSK